METPEAFRQRVHHEQRLIARLRLATARLEDAQQERIWVIVEAHAAGLSIRQIAAATGLSPSRIDQLLTADEAQEIPVWLSQLRDQGLSSDTNSGPNQPSPQHLIQTRLTDEVEVLRWCLDWLERGKGVIVNLRPDTDAETEFVRFDPPRVLRILARIAADVDELAGRPMEAAENGTDAEEEPRAKHRRRLAEPDPQPKPLS
jgi:trehalose utilization protein